MSVTIEQSAGMGRSEKRYLIDRLADETLGVQLVKRASSAHKGTPLGTFLELLSWELEEDRESLVRLMGALGVRRRRAGVLRLAAHSRESTERELASLDRLIHGKLDTWNALRSSVGDRVQGFDYDELIRRAEGQAEELERRRVAVGGTPLAGVC
jgi:hypothetical protein